MSEGAWCEAPDVINSEEVKEGEAAERRAREWERNRDREPGPGTGTGTAPEERQGWVHLLRGQRNKGRGTEQPAGCA